MMCIDSRECIPRGLGGGRRDLKCTIFVEVGAQPQLCRHIEDTLQATGLTEGTLVLPTLRKGKPALDSIYQAAAKLHVAGVELGWEHLMRGGQPVRLPPPGTCHNGLLGSHEAYLCSRWQSNPLHVLTRLYNTTQSGN